MPEPPGAVVVGGGLAGCEAAWQVARAGFEVVLYEMRPGTATEAHRTGLLAELVCSNSLKSVETTNAHGLLKEELRRLGSLLLAVAAENAVPAGKALAVDREGFARRATEIIESDRHIRLVRREVAELPDLQRTVCILASGPLTSARLHRSLDSLLGEHSLYFYDAISPIVSADSLDPDSCFAQGRWGHGDDYLNCPLDEELYRRFVAELVAADKVEARDFESARFFQGCLPVEEIAASGPLSLAYGPLKPVGLADPATGRRPFAVLQLRRENASGTMYNLVGCQTRLRQAEQRRVFGLIPALAQAAYLRYGSVHRNTFLNLPRVGSPVLEIAGKPNLLVAGQITGVEGYVESIGTGLLAGINAVRKLKGLGPAAPPRQTMLGALVAYVHGADPEGFQPMNANFGLLPPLDGPKTGRERRKEAFAARALEALDEFRDTCVRELFS
ncbi:MAG: methylenetetrahydrofolate--tRNA-(uracil(54)-C(5))-methyltransferase (FADH(2)-oxidizing) TrmFO [Candidatus Glassbacteria bacterium]|nr:methylenetetrahydrofolate--tRNA-(uracil(54)-C(5))-methyltransferase (FADH(2)-oxidizing) TrmFO [Candidatus Glassbacteria bacterium]